MGAISWGTRGRVPLTFSDGGHNMSCPPHFFLFRFCIWRGFKNKTDVCHVLCEELFILDGRPRIAKLMLKQSVVWQWCSRGRNLLDRDRDFTKNCETWSLRPRLETSKFVHFAEIFKTMSSSPLTWIFFKFLAFFRRVLIVFTYKYNKQKYLNYRNFDKPFLCNIQSLETWNLRDQDRDSQK